MREWWEPVLNGKDISLDIGSQASTHDRESVHASMDRLSTCPYPLPIIDTYGDSGLYRDYFLNYHQLGSKQGYLPSASMHIGA